MFSSVHNPIAKKAIEGWELSGVARLQSGTPLFLAGFNQFNQNATGVVLHNVTLPQLQSLMGVYKTSNFTAAGAPQGIVYYLPPPPANNVFSSSSLIDNTMAAFNVGGFNARAKSILQSLISDRPRRDRLAAPTRSTCLGSGISMWRSRRRPESASTRTWSSARRR